MSRKSILYLASIISGFGFVYTAFSAPPGSPYTPGETLAPTCAPGDANCTIDPPLYNGVSEAWIGATEASSQNTNGKALRKFHVEVTDTSNADWVPLTMVDAYIEPAANHVAGTTRIAQASYATIPASNTTTVRAITGLDGGAENYGTGQITGALYGLVGWGYNAANATASTVAGSWIGSESDDGAVSNLTGSDFWTGAYGGTVTNNKGINISMDHGGGTITNRYGIFINEFTGAATNDYAIWQHGNTQMNYFGGKIGIGGITNPQSSIHLDDNINIQHAGNFGTYNWNAYWNGAGWARSQAGYSSQISQDASGYLTIGVGDTGAADGVPAWRYPFYIKHSNGYIGVNTSNPKAVFQVESDIVTANSSGFGSFGINNYYDGANSRRIYAGYGMRMTQDNAALFSFQVATTGVADSTITWTNAFNINQTTGNIGFNATPTANPLTMASGAHVTAGGVWTNASSRKLKDNIEDLSLEEAYLALQQLQPKKYNYKASPEELNLGFIAEDVPELVAMNDRESLASMDIVAVLTKVIQDQERRISELEEVIANQ